jgi:putative transposase
MMASVHTKVSLSTLCGLFGYSRQSWYKTRKTSCKHQELNDKILVSVKSIRVDQPRIGTIKLHHLVNKELSIQGVSIGRDALYNLLRSKRMLIRTAKKYKPAATNGNGQSIYPDLRKDMNVIEINQLWSCDITYIDIKTYIRHCYTTFIVDEKSHKIVGYHVSTDMTAKETLRAFQMAISSQGTADGKFKHLLAFHTDRGSQFKSHLFQEFLIDHEINGSMTQEGKSSENPVSERLNGIIKNELMIVDSFDTVEAARNAIERAVKIYNEHRPHLSCNLLTPQDAHHKDLGVLKKLWRQRKNGSKQKPT